MAVTNSTINLTNKTYSPIFPFLLPVFQSILSNIFSSSHPERNVLSIDQRARWGLQEYLVWPAISQLSVAQGSRAAPSLVVSFPKVLEFLHVK